MWLSESNLIQEHWLHSFFAQSSHRMHYKNFGFTWRFDLVTDKRKPVTVNYRWRSSETSPIPRHTFFWTKIERHRLVFWIVMDKPEGNYRKRLWWWPEPSWFCCHFSCCHVIRLPPCHIISRLFMAYFLQLGPCFVYFFRFSWAHILVHTIGLAQLHSRIGPLWPITYQQKFKFKLHQIQI